MDALQLRFAVASCAKYHQAYWHAYRDIAASIQNNHPHIRYVEGEHRGYLLLDINQERAQAEWIFVDTAAQPESGFTLDERWMTRSGSNQLEPGQEASAPSDVRVPAPLLENTG